MLDVILGLSCGDMGIVQLASKAPFSFGRGRDEVSRSWFLSAIFYLKPLRIENGEAVLVDSRLRL